MTDTAPDIASRLVVLHLDHTVSRGGAEFALARTIAEAEGWHPVLGLPVSPMDDLGPYEMLREADVEIVQVGALDKAGASRTGNPLEIAKFARSGLGQARSIRRHAAFRRADVVHANTSRAGVHATLAAIGTGIPVVVHLRDLVDKVSLGSSGHAAFTRVALPRAAGVIANSATTLESARPYLTAGAPAAVIPSASGLFRQSASAAAASLRDEVQHVGMLARLDPWKGQELLIRAFAVAFIGTDVRLALGGSAEFGHHGHERALRSLVAELGLSTRVDFLGHVDDVTSFIMAQDVCVQASLRPEPLGQNVLQYLAAGRPTIVADAGGPAEWVTDGVNGLTFTPGDETGLAEALARMSSLPLRRRLAAGAATTPGLLTDRESAARHLDIFASVVARSARRR